MTSTVQSKPAKFGIIVDSASLFHMGLAMGIDQVNLVELKKIAKECVCLTMNREYKEAFAYYVTAADDAEKKFKKRVDGAGYKFYATEHREKGSDDDKVNQLIRDSNPSHISALVIVSTDLFDFKRELEKKQGQRSGMEIFFLAANLIGDEGYPIISPLALKAIDACKFHFYDLSIFRERIDLGHSVGRNNINPNVDFFGGTTTPTNGEVQGIAEAPQQVSLPASTSGREPKASQESPTPENIQDVVVKIAMVFPKDFSAKTAIDFTTSFSQFLIKNKVKGYAIELQPPAAVIALTLSKDYNHFSLFATISHFLKRNKINDFKISSSGK